MTFHRIFFGMWTELLLILRNTPVFFSQRVIEYGKIEDWNLLKSLYGLEKIKEFAIQFRTLDAVSLS